MARVEFRDQGLLQDGELRVRRGELTMLAAMVIERKRAASAWAWPPWTQPDGREMAGLGVSLLIVHIAQVERNGLAGHLDVQRCAQQLQHYRDPCKQAQNRSSIRLSQASENVHVTGISCHCVLFLIHLSLQRSSSQESGSSFLETELQSSENLCEAIPRLRAASKALPE